ncbi:NUDIX domain-containing protein [Ktedonosporobacter rubrisoli]|uniref:NUDIX domain-containing protein n=1 Tax=Ktedonosporobacter rubrisoli TaxID=2509675 RepID=A0A4V0Z0F6_KTERU|nr:NUDIX domain-containing protein [Ktedonosporobacter rubrisoli]QBD83051.1 NUDIX domain-containing protein [Ktedonosporobacter rubrisoli]
MIFSHLESLNVQHMTKNQPFCAGVIIIQDGYLVVTLNIDGLPPAIARDCTWRVGGVGGGQEPNETVWQCAQREAREELSTEIELLSSPSTYFHDIDTGDLYEVSCTDTIAPLLLERQSNLFPYTPYRPGLPAGPYTYFCLLFAQPVQPHIQPGDDVVGLLLLPLSQWAMLQSRPSLESLLEHGARLISPQPFPLHGRLWLPPNESFGTVVPLLQQHSELLVFRR